MQVVADDCITTKVFRLFTGCFIALFAGRSNRTSTIRLFGNIYPVFVRGLGTQHLRFHLERACYEFKMADVGWVHYCLSRLTCTNEYFIIKFGEQVASTEGIALVVLDTTLASEILFFLKFDLF
ncbi:putative S-formylglutathione hydrolase [Helianthus annuus]|nr:putative S-formylglutathione hydrolase [Helianthus annuus]